MVTTPTGLLSTPASTIRTNDGGMSWVMVPDAAITPVARRRIQKCQGAAAVAQLFGEEEQQRRQGGKERAGDVQGVELSDAAQNGHPAAVAEGDERERAAEEGFEEGFEIEFLRKWSFERWRLGGGVILWIHGFGVVWWLR